MPVIIDAEREDEVWGEGKNFHDIFLVYSLDAIVDYINSILPRKNKAFHVRCINGDSRNGDLWMGFEKTKNGYKMLADGTDNDTNDDYQND